MLKPLYVVWCDVCKDYSEKFEAPDLPYGWEERRDGDGSGSSTTVHVCHFCVQDEAEDEDEDVASPPQFVLVATNRIGGQCRGVYPDMTYVPDHILQDTTVRISTEIVATKGKR